MAEIILKGHKVAKGKVEGEALVSHEPISFLSGVNTETGVVIEKNHELEGVNISDKILVFPVGKGSTCGSFIIYEMARFKTAPGGMINQRADPIIAMGAIISNIPMVDRLDGDPIDVIKTGDHVELDADKGTVKVSSRH